MTWSERSSETLRVERAEIHAARNPLERFEKRMWDAVIACTAHVEPQTVIK